MIEEIRPESNQDEESEETIVPKDQPGAKTVLPKIKDRVSFIDPDIHKGYEYMILSRG